MSNTFLKHFNSITDHRMERCKKYELIDIILLAISAVLSAVEDWKDIKNFGHIKLEWLSKFRPFDAAIPRHDMLSQVTIA
jgi:hypothetical protein